jgi:hypothetical protein
MIKLNMELPPEVARLFVEDMEAYFSESKPLNYRRPRDGKLRLPDVRAMFKLMHDFIEERKS